MPRDLYKTTFALLLVIPVFGCTMQSAGEGEVAKPLDVDAGVSDVDLERDPLDVLRTMALESYPPLPEDVTNRYRDNPDAQRFGQQLFFDKRFSGPLIDEDNNGFPGTLGAVGDTGRIACASCHVPESGFSDTRSPAQQLALGAGWGHRKPPSLLDVGYKTLLMWDGRHDTAYNQVFGAMEAWFEMNTHRLFVAQQIARNHADEYESIFGPLPDLLGADFPQVTATEAGCADADIAAGMCISPAPAAAMFDALPKARQDEVNRAVVNAGKAIQAYHNQLRCGTSRFDAWALGDEEALSEQEKHGAELFAGKAMCASCHSGPLFTENRFYNVGLAPGGFQEFFLKKDDEGAAEGFALAQNNPLNSQSAFSDGYDGRLEMDSSDESYVGAFKTPGLRCVSQRPSYFHTGQYSTLEDVLSFFNRGGHQGGYVGTKTTRPLGLSDSERAAIVAFLKALDGPGPDAGLLVEPE